MYINHIITLYLKCERVVDECNILICFGCVCQSRIFHQHFDPWSSYSVRIGISSTHECNSESDSIHKPQHGCQVRYCHISGTSTVFSCTTSIPIHIVPICRYTILNEERSSIGLIGKRSVPKSDFEQLHTSHKITEKTSQIVLIGHINIHTFLEQCTHGLGVGLDSVSCIINIFPQRILKSSSSIVHIKGIGSTTQYSCREVSWCL